MTRKRLGALALFASIVVLFALPVGSFGALDLRQAADALKTAGDQVQSGLASTVQKTGQKTAALVAKTKSAVQQKSESAKTRATATDPPKQPPMHGSNPHGQGDVAVVDLNPKSDRPLDGKPDGSGSGEDAVVGRAKGEQDASGNFHGHITTAALFGTEIIGVDSTPGQTNHGPLQPLQTGVLDPICMSTNQQICLAVLKSDSSTTATGSTNDFAVANAGLLGLNVGAAESHGNITQDSNCQSAVGTAKTANVTTSGGTVAGVANATSASKSCRGAAPQVAQTSEVINLGGTGVGLPAPGCANGTPDTEGGIPGLLPIICNAEEVAGAAAVRDALDVFALQVGTNALLRESTAGPETLTVAPAGETGPQCNDKVDNDGDGKIDSSDPGCHTDGNANNANSFDATDNDEADAYTGGSGNGTGHGNGNGNGNNGSGNGNGNGNGAGNGNGNGGPQCSNGIDDDGDGVIDSADPGCHTDGNANNAASFNPNDDSEGSGAGSANSGSLPFTGSDAIGISLAGLLMLAGGLLLRRREDVATVR
jgi:LPXTG-motif cell wall-anchored protein